MLSDVFVKVMALSEIIPFFVVNGMLNKLLFVLYPIATRHLFLISETEDAQSCSTYKFVSVIIIKPVPMVPDIGSVLGAE